jgi:hypothetical protein
VSDLGQWAADLHEIEGYSWREIYEKAKAHPDHGTLEGLDVRKVRDHGRSHIDSHKDDYPGKPGVTIDQSNDNTATVYYRGPQLHSPQDLLDYIGWDPDEWIVTHKEGGYYQQTSKREEASLTYEGGVATGTVDKGGVILSGMIRLRVKLVRKNPVPIAPVITPIVSSVVYATPPLPSRAGLQRALIIPDPQFGFTKRVRDAKLTPFHDRRVLDLALQIAAVAEPDRVMWPGDNLDMTDWTSRFTRAPEFYWTTRPALLEWHWWLAQFRAMDAGLTLEVFDGNHEDRMRTAMQDHLPAACGLASDDYEFTDSQVLELVKLAGLDTLGIRFIGDYPNGAVWLNERVLVRHGADSRMQLDGFVVIEGHYHRRQWIAETRWTARGPQVIESFCPGCACSLDRVPGKSNTPDWQQGLALVDYDPHGTAYNITPIPVFEGRAIWNGQLFTARERTEELRSAYPGWNW